MIEFSREAFFDVFDEANALVHQHYEEIAHYQDIPLDPDMAVYDVLVVNDALRCYVARDEGVLAGYAVFAIRPHPHYRGSLTAHQDVIFLAKQYRNLGFGRSFITYCDQQLKALGVQVVAHHTKVAHDFGPLLETLGYELVERVFTRRLDKWDGQQPQR